MLEKLRNIGIIAHVDAGKTTTTEHLLLLSGAKHRAGAVDQGTTTTDSDVAEQRMGITINSAAVTIEWGETRINIIDTPGHVDFTAEVERSLRVLDGGVCVFCAAGGVEVQSETVWFQANKHNAPRLAYVNKLDRMGADFYECVEQMKDKLHAVPAICAIPVGQGPEFRGIIDLVEMQFILRDGEGGVGSRYSLVEIPDTHSEEAVLRRQQLLDTVSRFDDRLLEPLLEGRPVPPALLRASLRKATLQDSVTPVVCGSSMRYHGLELLLDAVVDYLPSPLDRGAIHGAVYRKKEERMVRHPDPREPLAALAFKTVTEASGDLVYVRIYSGELCQGQTVLNTSTGERERVARLCRMMGARGKDLPSVGPGEIVALVGLKGTATGHTLSAESDPIVLEEIRFPEPVIAQAIIPDRTTDETKLAESLARLVRDDPTLKFRVDGETRQLILSGMGELHLAIALEKLMRHPGVKVTAGRPMVAYRQTLARAVEVETRYIRRSGGRGKYAVITCLFEPLTREESARLAENLQGDGGKPDPNAVYFDERVVGGVVPREFIPSVEAGFREECRKGARFGFPIMRLRCTLLDGKHHEVESSTESFRLAAMECTREAQAQAGVSLLEPIMNVVVVGPEKYQGTLVGDLNRRRGEILNFSSEAGRCRIQALVPLAELFGYTGDLRNASGGTASFSMEPSHYAEVKEELADLRRIA
jgi:elongation factor G